MSEALRRRDWFVDGAVRAAKNAGQEVNVEAVARQAAKDLTVVDRATADGSLKVKKERKRTTAERDEATDRAARRVAESAAKRGGKLYAKKLKPKERAKPLPKLYGVDAMKLAAMQQRIAAICAPVPSYVPKKGDVIGAGSRHPKFAAELAMHTMGMARGLMSYVGLSWADRMRKYQRACEDICDRSDAVFLVNWWVK